MYSRMWYPPTLFPGASSEGPKTPIPILLSEVATIPLPTQLLAGIPTLMENSSDPSYIQQVTISDLTIFTIDLSIN